MGCFSGPSVSGSDQVLQREYAEISREQFDDYRNRYEPLFGELNRTASQDIVISEEVDRALQGVDGSFEKSREISDRRMAGYGISLSADQRAARDRVLEGRRLRTRADVSNRTRLDAKDRQDATRADLIAVAQGIRQESQGAFSSVAGLENQRGISNAQQKASFQSTLLGGGLALGGLALLSSREAKEKIRDADAPRLRDVVRAWDIKHYEYKPERGGPGTRTGVIAEDTAAPASTGKVVDLGDVLFTLAGAVQDIDSEIRSMRAAA